MSYLSPTHSSQSKKNPPANLHKKTKIIEDNIKECQEMLLGLKSRIMSMGQNSENNAQLLQSNCEKLQEYIDQGINEVKDQILVDNQSILKKAQKGFEQADQMTRLQEESLVQIDQAQEIQIQSTEKNRQQVINRQFNDWGYIVMGELAKIKSECYGNSQGIVIMGQINSEQLDLQQNAMNEIFQDQTLVRQDLDQISQSLQTFQTQIEVVQDNNDEFQEQFYHDNLLINDKIQLAEHSQSDQSLRIKDRWESANFMVKQLQQNSNKKVTDSLENQLKQIKDKVNLIAQAQFNNQNQTDDSITELQKKIQHLEQMYIQQYAINKQSNELQNQFVSEKKQCLEDGIKKTHFAQNQYIDRVNNKMQSRRQQFEDEIKFLERDFSRRMNLLENSLKIIKSRFDN